MNDKFVTLAITSLSRAEILRGRLEAKGIGSFIKNEHAITPVYPQGHVLRIKLSDVERALPIALHMKEEFALSDTEIEPLNKDVENILFPTDFSEHSYNAFHYALHMAGKLDAKITLLHVYYDATTSPIAAVDSYAYHIGMDVDLQAVEENAKLEMNKFVAYFAEKTDLTKLKIEQSLVGGVVEDTILDTAKSTNADLILIGTQGIGRKSSDFFGSISAFIIKESVRPVMCIPASAKFEAWQTKAKVLYATKFEPNDYLAIRKLMRLFYVFDIKLTCAHVKTSDAENWDNIRSSSLLDHLKEEYTGYEIDCKLVENADVVKGLEGISEDIDILAITTHRHSLFEELFEQSLSDKMLLYASKPLLIFHG